MQPCTTLWLSLRMALRWVESKVWTPKERENVGNLEWEWPLQDCCSCALSHGWGWQRGLLTEEATSTHPQIIAFLDTHTHTHTNPKTYKPTQFPLTKDRKLTKSAEYYVWRIRWRILFNSHQKQKYTPYSKQWHQWLRKERQSLLESTSNYLECHCGWAPLLLSGYQRWLWELPV